MTKLSFRTSLVYYFDFGVKYLLLIFISAKKLNSNEITALLASQPIAKNSVEIRHFSTGGISATPGGVGTVEFREAALFFWIFQGVGDFYVPEGLSLLGHPLNSILAKKLC